MKISFIKVKYLVLFLCLWAINIFIFSDSLHAKTDKSTSLIDIRISHSSNSARLTLVFDGDTPFKFLTLSNPYRMVIDIPNLIWKAPKNPLPTHKGLISGLRHGQYKENTIRIVLDFKKPITIDKYAELPTEKTKLKSLKHLNKSGRRLYIDLVSVSDFKPQRYVSSNWPPKKIKLLNNKEPLKLTKPKAPPKYKTKSKKVTIAKFSNKLKKLIVLDPGHGGIDPGSIGAKTSIEKIIVLRIAKAAKKRLEASGKYRVILTRNKDIYIPLRERFEIAEDNKADLFISLHTDKLSDKKVQGTSIYTLSDKASDNESDLLAAKENRSDILTGHALELYSEDVSSILIDLAQESTNRLSWRFAEALLRTLKNKIKTIGKPHRYAGFAVLKSPNIASILIELGFLSNYKDRQLLVSKQFSQTFSYVLLTALNNYFK